MSYLVDSPTVDLHYSAAMARLESSHPHLHETLVRSETVRETFKKLMTWAAIRSVLDRLAVTQMKAKTREEAARMFTEHCLDGCKLVADRMEQRFLWENVGSNTCCVCTDDVVSVGAYRLDCGHTFHADCICDWWIRTDADDVACPLCRRVTR